MSGRTAADRAGLDAQLFDRWQKAAETDMTDKPGALDDLIAELFDWFNEAEPISLQALDGGEAVEAYREIAAQWGIESDVEGELHRVKVLALGADRTPEEVLENLVQMERERIEELEAIYS